MSEWKKIASLIMFLLSISLACACEWDYDTIKMELRPFPELNNLITGKFLVHSDSYYEWRIQNRMQLLKHSKGDDVDHLYDDIAVSYDKLNRSEEAIALMEERYSVDGSRYENLANLGTFYTHNGELENGLTFLRKAVQVNPGAHFGREQYQILLIEYVILKRGQNIRLPMHTDDYDFTAHLGLWLGHQPTDDELGEAIVGISGMIKFGNYNSPFLLETLGDLLAQREDNILAAKAYLAAGYYSDDESVYSQYKSIILDTRLLGMQRIKPLHLGVADENKLDLIEEELLEEIQIGADYRRKISSYENQWILENKNLDDELDRKFYNPNLIMKVVNLLSGL